MCSTRHIVQDKEGGGVSEVQYTAYCLSYSLRKAFASCKVLLRILSSLLHDELF
jgi:hypothetical protein